MMIFCRSGGLTTERRILTVPLRLWSCAQGPNLLLARDREIGSTLDAVAPRFKGDALNGYFSNDREDLVLGGSQRSTGSAATSMTRTDMCGQGNAMRRQPGGLAALGPGTSTFPPGPSNRCGDDGVAIEINLLFYEGVLSASNFSIPYFSNANVRHWPAY